jgi:hypothetical protein
MVWFLLFCTQVCYAFRRLEKMRIETGPEFAGSAHKTTERLASSRARRAD